MYIPISSPTIVIDAVIHDLTTILLFTQYSSPLPPLSSSLRHTLIQHNDIFKNQLLIVRMLKLPLYPIQKYPMSMYLTIFHALTLPWNYNFKYTSSYYSWYRRWSSNSKSGSHYHHYQTSKDGAKYSFSISSKGDYSSSYYCTHLYWSYKKYWETSMSYEK